MVDDLEQRRDDDGNAYDVVVLGAGITGLVAASILLKQGYKKILVADEYPHIGGNHINYNVGDYTFDIGSFIFQDNSPLLKHIPEILPRYVPINPSWGRLNPQGLVTQYPISIKDDLVAAGPIEWLRIGASVVYARLFRRELHNARDYARFWIGARLLYRTGLENYMARFYGQPPEKIDLKFAQDRMFWIREHAGLRNLARRLFSRAATRSGENTQLARPKQGFSHLYELAAKRLGQSGVTFVLGKSFQHLEKLKDVFHVSIGGEEIVAGRVLSTIPLDRIQQICGLTRDDKLLTVTLISLFFSFSGDRGFGQSVLYNFSHSGAWKRLTVYSDFYGKSADREYFTVEVNADHISDSVELGAKDFRRHTLENGLFDGDLRLEGSHKTSNAYPVYTERADERAAGIIRELAAFGVESLGRQGGFDYQPTARVTALRTEKSLDRT